MSLKNAENISVSYPVGSWNRARTFLQTPSNRLFAALCVLLWLSLITPPTLYPFESKLGFLDGSWQACNGYFLRHHLHAGVDFVFPTWLLGFFYGSVYDSGLYWPFYAWQLLLCGGLTAMVARFALRFPRSAERISTLCACGVCLTLLRSDMLYYVLLLLAGSGLLYSSASRPARSLLLVFLLVLLALLKFSFVALAVVIVALAALRNSVFVGSSRPLETAALPASDAKLPTGKNWVAVLSPLLFALIFAGVWLLFGQRISDLLLALRNEVAVSIGYNETMGFASTKRTLLIGVAALGLFGLLLLMQRQRSSVFLSGAALLAVATVLLWKHGFVRGDNGHSSIFFGTLIVIVLLLPVYFGTYKVQTVWQQRARWLCVCVCFAGVVLPFNRAERKTMASGLMRQPLNNALFVFAPWIKRQQLEAEQSQLRVRWRLPRVQRVVGDAALDVFSYEQEIAFLNGLVLHARPVYQGYSAYTSALCALNANFYRSADAPAFVLFRLETIDGRMPALDDNQTLLELLRSYHPVLVEEGFTLLARNVSHAPVPPAVSHSAAAPQPRTYAARLGQEIPVGDDAPYHLLTLRARPTLRGKLKSALLRANALTIVIQMDDGRRVNYLLPPAMAEAGVLLDPLLEDSQDVVRLYANLPGKRARSFRLECSSPSLFQQPLEVTLTPRSDLIGERLPSMQASRLLAPSLWPHINEQAGND